MTDKDFIKELNDFLEYPLSPFGEKKVRYLLEKYLKENKIEIVAEKVIYKDRYISAPIRTAKKSVGIKDIIRITCEEVGITEDELKQLSRVQPWVFARQCVFYFARFYTYLSLKDISRYVGGKDHTTVIHGIKAIANIIELDGRDDRYNVVARIYKRINDLTRGDDGTIEMNYGKLNVEVPIKEIA